MEKAAPYLAALAAAVVAAGFGYAIAGWIAFAIGAVAAAVPTAFVLRQVMDKKHEARLIAVATEEFGREWPEQWRQLVEAYRKEHAQWKQARSAAKEQWAETEKDRIRWAKRLMKGDEEAIQQTLEETLSDLDFPFDTKVDVGLLDWSCAYLNLDLPEIEDVVPDKRFRVLKSGDVREVNRKADERNEAYARLACGLALMLAGTVLSAAPTLDRVRIAGYTQRAQRGSTRIEDDYVYDVQLTRKDMEAFNADTVDSIWALDSVGASMDRYANWGLKKLQKPAWVSEM